MKYRMRMRPRLADLAMWVAAAALVLTAAISWRSEQRSESPPLTVPALAKAPSALSLDSIDAMVRLIQDTDPFYLADAEEPAPTASSPLPETEPVPVIPQLVLHGIVGGPPWAAVILGVPGRNGPVVLHEGDSVPPFRVRRIREDGLELERADSTIRLGLTRARR